MAEATGDLVQWYGEQLDEDKRIARATTPVPVAGHWAAVRDKHADEDAPLSLIQGQDPHEPGYKGYSSGVPIIAISGDWPEAEANLRHTAEWDPARVLREIEGKRRIMECHEPWTASNGDTICGRCGREHIDGRPGGHFPCQTLRLLAEVYDQRPGYREEWRP